ncbi:MAG: hypothetical protein J6A89_01730 [Clostridia bacterium]|nr:hypothetical protein [Clostridia bacterium]
MESSNLQAVLDFIYVFGIIACVMSILIALFKGLVDTDEMPVYLKKIKKSLIALVLVITISTTVSVTQNYFFSNGVSYSDDTYFGIGKLPENTGLEYIDDNTSLNDNDKEGREVVIIDGEKYVVTSRDKELYGKKQDNGWSFADMYVYGYEDMKVRVDALKYFNDCQGFSSGSDLTTKVQLYRVHKEAYDSYSGVDDKGKNGKKISEYLSVKDLDSSTRFSKNTGYIINWHSYDEVKRDVESGDCYVPGV